MGFVSIEDYDEENGGYVKNDDVELGVIEYKGARYLFDTFDTKPLSISIAYRIIKVNHKNDTAVATIVRDKKTLEELSEETQRLLGALN